MISVKGRTRNILLILGTIIILFLVWYFSAIVTYILISVVLSFLGRPLVKWAQMIKIWKFRVSKTLAAFLALIVIWLVFIGFFRFMIPLLIREFEILSTVDFNSVLETIQEPISKIASFTQQETIKFDKQKLYELVLGQLYDKDNISELSGMLGAIAGTIGEILIAFFSVSFITFFFLKDESMFRDALLLIIPSNFEEKVAHIMDSISVLLRRYFIGLLFEVTMVIVLVTAGLTIVGVGFSHAIVIGLFCGLFNVIPYLGPWMGAAVGLLIGVAININFDFTSHTLPLLGLMVLVFATVQILDNILFQPIIYSNSVKAHPLEIFLVIMAAGSLAGILGMILAIPAYTILRVIAKEFFDNMKLVQRLTKDLDNTKV